MDGSIYITTLSINFSILVWKRFTRVQTFEVPSLAWSPLCNSFRLGFLMAKMRRDETFLLDNLGSQI